MDETSTVPAAATGAGLTAGLPPVTVPDIAEAPLVVPADALRRFTVAEYHALIAAGLFADDENFELLEGLIVRQMTKHPSHWIAAGALRDALAALKIPGHFIHAQDPVSTADSEPEPDLALIRGERRDYLAGNPDPQAAPLVIEVADSSLDKDRRWKQRIYAIARIPVYWIVNLVDRQIEVYSEPSGPARKPRYAKCEIFGAGYETPVVIGGSEVGRIAVSDVLP